MNRTLEGIARAIFKSWFIDFDPVRAKMDGRQPAAMDAETAALFPDEFEDSPLGKIPKGWKVGAIEDATSLIIDHRGKTPKKLGDDWSNNGIPVLSAKSIKNGRLIRNDAIRYIKPSLYERWMKDPLVAGDILMTSEAPLGELLYLSHQTLYCLGQRLYGIRANPAKCQSAYLFHTLASRDTQARIIGRATGTTVQGIRQSELRRVSLLIAELNIQKQFSSIVEPIFSQIFYNREQEGTLTSIRDILLPKFLSGEIHVKDAEKVLEEVV